MKKVYYLEFRPLKNVSLIITKEICGKISEAVLQIEVRGNKLILDLKNPKVPSNSSNTAQESFSNISSKTVNYLNINGEQHRDDTTFWKLEFGSKIIVHCSAIDGLPKEGWKDITNLVK
jgi:hypothetical protein